MGREQEARKLTEQAKELNLLIGRTWVKLAAIYKRVVDEKLWNVQYDSFGDWLAKVGDKGESQAYSLVATYRDLEEPVPEEAMERMTISNARDLTNIPAAKRTAALVKAGAEQTNNEFRETLNKAVPGIALEQKSYKGFQLEKSQKEMVMRAINFARHKEEIESDEGALEFICAQYLISEGEIVAPEKPKPAGTSVDMTGTVERVQ